MNSTIEHLGWRRPGSTRPRTWRHRAAAAGAVTALVWGTLPGGIVSAGPAAASEAKDQATAAQKHAHDNADAIQKANDRAKSLVDKSGDAAHHARDAADKAAEIATKAIAAAGGMATAYVEVADAVAALNWDTSSADDAARTASEHAASVQAAATSIVGYLSLAKDAAHQAEEDAKVADKDPAAVTDAQYQSSLTDSYATATATNLATAETSTTTSTSYQLVAATTQKTTQQDADSLTRLMKAASTGDLILTPVTVPDSGGGDPGSGDPGTGGSGGGSGDPGTGGGSGGSGDPGTGGGSGGSGGGSGGSGGGTPGTGSGGTPATGGGPTYQPAPPVTTTYYAPVAPTRVLAQRYTTVFANTTTPTTTTGGLAGNAPAATARTGSSSHPFGQPTTSGPSVRHHEPSPPGRQHVTGQPAGAEPRRAIAGLGAVPLLTALLLIEALILGRRLGQRVRRGRSPRSRFAMA